MKLCSKLYSKNVEIIIHFYNLLENEKIVKVWLNCKILIQIINVWRKL